MRKILAAIAVLTLVFGLAACGKEVDRNLVKAVKVEGTHNLWRFCDTTTLIYFEANAGNDEYVLVWPGACTPDGKQRDMTDNTGQQANEPGGDN